MLGLYVFAAVVGWAFVAFFILFGADADTGFDVDADADLDLDLDTGAGGGLAALATDYLSFRALVFFAALFGLTGVVLDLLDANGAFTLAAAVAMGVFAVWLNARLIRYVKQSSVTTSLRDADMAGLAGEVVLPVGPGRKGRVAIEVDGQRRYLVATPFRASGEFSVGDRVVVIEVERGGARIAAMDELEP